MFSSNPFFCSKHKKKNPSPTQKTNLSKKRKSVTRRRCSTIHPRARLSRLWTSLSTWCALQKTLGLLQLRPECSSLIAVCQERYINHKIAYYSTKKLISPICYILEGSNFQLPSTTARLSYANSRGSQRDHPSIWIIQATHVPRLRRNWLLNYFWPLLNDKNDIGKVEESKMLHVFCSLGRNCNQTIY